MQNTLECTMTNIGDENPDGSTALILHALFVISQSVKTMNKGKYFLPERPKTSAMYFYSQQFLGVA